jgi:LssY-like putative type I secretion system component LssY
VKFLIARSPDSEIYFPAGTELILRVMESVNVPEAANPRQIARFTPEETAEAHRILESYPEQRAEKGGKPSDLVNILFLANAQQIDRAFRAAGWSGAERTSPMSIYRMYHCLVERSGYKRAPMGKMTLNGTPADAAYQKSLNTFSRRHHLRLWKDRQYPDAWLSAATEDTAIRVQRMHLTHTIDPRIDDERAKVVNDLVFTGCVESAALLPRDSVPRKLNEKGEGVLMTDGSIAVLRLNDCHASQTPPLSIARTRPRRLVQSLVALRKDVVRSNLAFVGYRMIKLAAGNSKSSSAKTVAAADRKSALPPAVTPDRTRSSIFDAANRRRSEPPLNQ